MELTPDGVFRRYEGIRSRLPAMPTVTSTSAIADLLEIAPLFDVFICDAFGVLNIGDTVVPGASEKIALLKALGKTVIVLTNAATNDTAELFHKFERLGFAFSVDEIVSSRMVLLASLRQFTDVLRWGAIMPENGSRDGLAPETLTKESDGFWDSDGFLFLSSKGWDENRQNRLVSELKRRARPVLVGNPDLVAPREHGFTREAGFFAHDIIDRTGCDVTFFGKPFGNVFREIAKRLINKRGFYDEQRTLMIGDTLHTDIIGAAAAGISSALVTGTELTSTEIAMQFIEASGIQPNFMIPAL
jgi:HAD superfamily hydrolase (TIGR01450 family)